MMTNKKISELTSKDNLTGNEDFVLALTNQNYRVSVQNAMESFFTLQSSAYGNQNNGFPTLNAAGKITSLTNFSHDASYFPISVQDTTSAVVALSNINSYAGEVKVNGAGGVKPSIIWGSGGVAVGTEVLLEYGAGSLDFSGDEIIKWPNNISSPQDADFYNDIEKSFLENTIVGQRHEWRFDFKYTGKGGGATTGVRFRIYNTNPSSSFNLIYEYTIPNERTEGGLLIIFRTIADSLSLPAPTGSGHGYNIAISADDPITIELDSVLRSSVIPNRIN
jgi:hypothetical protein